MRMSKCTELSWEVWLSLADGSERIIALGSVGDGISEKDARKYHQTISNGIESDKPLRNVTGATLVRVTREVVA